MFKPVGPNGTGRAREAGSGVFSKDGLYSGVRGRQVGRLNQPTALRMFSCIILSSWLMGKVPEGIDFDVSHQ